MKDSTIIAIVSMGTAFSLIVATVVISGKADPKPLSTPQPTPVPEPVNVNASRNDNKPDESESWRRDAANEVIKAHAWERAKTAILYTLNDPASADFPLADYQFSVVADDYVIFSYVDAHNRSGITLRKKFAVTMTTTDRQHFVIKNILWDDGGVNYHPDSPINSE